MAQAGVLPLRSCLLAVLSLLCTLWLPGSAWAGLWEAGPVQGLAVRMAPHPMRPQEGYALERVATDGSLDASFGQQGTLAFSLGPDNDAPASLRMDTTGRLWVAGASAGHGDQTQAVVMRFLPQGKADAGYAMAGRSTSAPAGQQARALDLAPQADGSAWVVGLLTDSAGQEHAGWWRLRPDGVPDPAFGRAGAWIDARPGTSLPLDVATAPDGSTALLLQHQGAAAQLEIWVLAPGSQQPTLAQRLPDTRGAGLRWQAGTAGWSVAAGGPLPLPLALLALRDAQAASAAAPAAASGADLYRPATPNELASPWAASASAAAAGAESAPWPGWAIGLLIVAGLAAGGGGWWAWRRRQAPAASPRVAERHPVAAPLKPKDAARAPAPGPASAEGAAGDDDTPWP